MTDSCKMPRQLRGKTGCAQRHEIAFNGLPHGGVLDFHRDFFTAFGYGPMHLARDAAANGSGSKERKTSSGYLPNALLNCARIKRRVHRRSLHLQSRQFFDHLRSQKMGLHAQSLAEFHDRPAKALKLLAHLLRVLAAQCLTPPVASSSLRNGRCN